MAVLPDKRPAGAQRHASHSDAGPEDNLQTGAQKRWAGSLPSISLSDLWLTRRTQSLVTGQGEEDTDRKGPETKADKTCVYS